MTDRELMQEALYALTYVGDAKEIYSDTIESLRARLAQPEQEPLEYWNAVEGWVSIPNEDEATPAAWVYPSFWSDLERVNCGTAYRNPTVDRIPLYTAPPQQPERKLWLWKNFVDGRPEYWAFDNPYPTNLDNGDPQTLGQPCGYAIFKPSRDGSCGRTEEQVLREMESVSARSERDEAPAKAVEWQGLTDEEANELTYASIAEIEAKLKEKNT